MNKCLDDPDELLKTVTNIHQVMAGSIGFENFVNVSCEFAKSHPEATKKFAEKLQYASESFWDKLASIGINVYALKKLIEIVCTIHVFMFDSSALLKLIGVLWKDEDNDSDKNKCSCGKLMSKL